MTSIPKIIHQVWIGPNPIPEFCVEFMDEMKNKHEKLGYIYKFWGNEIWDIYKEDKFLQNYKKDPKTFKYAYICDRVRLLLLRDYGGITLDVDCKIIKDFNVVLNKLNENITYFAAVRRFINKGATIEVGIQGSTKNSRIIQEYLSLYKDINWACGGKMMSDKMIEIIDTDVALFNYRYFLDNKITKDTIILHEPYALGTWRPKHTKPKRNK
eukprot:SAG11_NODE_33_length_22289_cov_12.857999_39_plen_212_part_00